MKVFASFSINVAFFALSMAQPLRQLQRAMHCCTDAHCTAVNHFCDGEAANCRCTESPCRADDVGVGVCKEPDPFVTFTNWCFSEIATVDVLGKGSVMMKDLQLGAKVLAKSGNYETVYAFGHRDPTQPAEFLQFQTKDSKLEVTGAHLIFLEGKEHPVRADSIKVGDVLQGNNAKIQKIRTVHRTGVYTPLTTSGTVVVDGLAASSYISLQKGANAFVELQGGHSTFLSYHNAIHMALSPFRMCTMGVSSSLGNTYTENGIPIYAAFGMNFAHWAEQQNIVAQIVLFLLFGVITGTCLFVESIFGASTAPLAVMIGAGVYVMTKKTGGTRSGPLRKTQL